MIVQPTKPTLSPSTLRVFEDCQRLYEYSFLAPRPWPAPTNSDQEATEDLLLAGQRLHQLVHLRARGLDPAPLAATDERLQRWYQRYLASPFAVPSGRTFSEQALTWRSHGRKLVVKLDFIMQDGDRWVIVDWKTARRAPDKTHLDDDWQARLYPFSLVEAGSMLNGGRPIAADQIEMIFWYLEADTHVRLPYNDTKHEITRAALSTAIARIEQAEVMGMDATGKQTQRCIRPSCRFYSLCHMTAPPPSIAGVMEGEQGAQEPDQVEVLLTLVPEYEFDDEPVLL